MHGLKFGLWNVQVCRIECEGCWTSIWNNTPQWELSALWRLEWSLAPRQITISNFSICCAREMQHRLAVLKFRSESVRKQSLDHPNPTIRRRFNWFTFSETSDGSWAKKSFHRLVTRIWRAMFAHCKQVITLGPDAKEIGEKLLVWLLMGKKQLWIGLRLLSLYQEIELFQNP